MGQATESESCKLKDCGKIRLNDVSKNKNIALSINNDVILNQFHRLFYDFVVSESCDDNIQKKRELTAEVHVLLVVSSKGMIIVME